MAPQLCPPKATIEQALLRELYYLIKMFRYQNDNYITSSSNALIEHRQIAYAIQQRDPLLAETAMRQHIKHASDRIKKHFVVTH